jgi:anti-sigma regulatory factor (Ser/Thr protein kinase)
MGWPMVPLTFSLPIQEPNQVGEVRRAVVESASRLGLSEEATGRLALIATELGTNLVKHGGGGEILFRPLNSGSSGLEILALDKGPGISDWKQVSRDGYSTAGSPGNGLGAIMRLSSEYFFYSLPQRGTIICARVRSPGIPNDEQDFEVGGICLPIHGETECGDCWAVMPGRTGIRVIVADGLGHGPMAAEASQAAMRIAREFPDLAPAPLLEKAHDALRATRGAAVAVAEIDRQKGTVRFAGVGNISAAIAADGALRQMMSHNGTAGLHARKFQEFSYPWPSSAMLVMHSDGLSGRWTLGGYPGIAMRHASILAAALYRDHTRGRRDDVTVLALREKTAVR